MGERGALVPAPSQGRLQLDLPDELSSVPAAGGMDGRTDKNRALTAQSVHPSREVRGDRL